LSFLVRKSRFDQRRVNEFKGLGEHSRCGPGEQKLNESAGEPDP
jgi:hypothetical protein